MTVYKTRSRAAKVHASPDCPQLTQRAHFIREVDLEELTGPRFCKRCFPDFPRIPRVWHPTCYKCHPERRMPCEHNGGVQILVWRVNLTVDPLGNRVPIKTWVWPENVGSRTLVNPVQRG